jgi:hypothetical protein
VSLPKDSEKESKAIMDWITQRYQQAHVEEKRLVPWKRLTSWIKERHEMSMKDPEKVVMPPLDKFGATVGRVVQIKEKRR